MSVKTCQLCGKPLGRMRSGDGDFCSREHRNQFRLRRGMDRLEEANKVASLMRRRENPRQIPASQLAVVGECQPRPSTEPAPFPVGLIEPQFGSLQPVLFQARILPKDDRFSNPLSDLARRSGLLANRTVTPASLPFVSRRPRQVLESRKNTEPAAGVVRAGSASLRCQVPATAVESRECGAVLRVTRRPVFAQRQSEPALSIAASIEKSRQLQMLIACAAGIGAGETKTYPRREFAKRAPVLRIRARSLDLRDGRPQLPPRRSRVGEPAELRPSSYELADPAVPRTCLVSWEAASPVSLPGPHGGGLKAGMGATKRLLALDVRCEGGRDHRPATVAFAPAESPFELLMPRQDAFSASGSEAARPILEFFEEHFDSGLQQWVGDVVDWKLDDAGALPAGLALFRPTLGLGDYEFEFYTRIEDRAVTYAFRAANVSNYLKVTIAMVESGRYELRRCAVIGGIEEPAATAPLPGVLRPGAAFTVKTRASQNDFMIWLEGELAARWTDGRMPTGGIGFLAPRDGRARVYWVKLSQIEGPNSQAAAHRTVRSIQ